MKSLLYALLCIPIMTAAQQKQTPAWEQRIVSEIPFQTTLSNEFKAAAEEMIVKKWTQQILNIVLADEATLAQNRSKELFLFQIQNRAAGKVVTIPIGIKMDEIRKIKKGNSKALKQFMEEIEDWILRFI